MSLSAKSVRTLASLLMVAVIGLPGPAFCEEDEGQNFQVSPPPIAYPYFVAGRQDTKVTLTYFQMSFQDIDLAGGGLDMVYRDAIDKTFAWDGEFGLMIMTSKDIPVPPVIDTYVNGDMVIVTGSDNPTTMFFSIPMSLNLEVQAVHEPELSMIVFGGPNLGFMFGSITPEKYRATIWDLNFDGKFTSLTPTYDFGMSVASMLGGIQFGAQFGIPVGDWNFAPFLMIRATGGTMTMTQKSGYKEVSGNVMTFDIPMSVARSIGTDIIYEPWGLSIGAILQQISANKTENDQSSLLLQMSYHFRTTREKKGSTVAEPEKSVASRKKGVVRKSRQSVRNIAVMDFKADGVSASDAAVTTNLLRNELVKTEVFNVVEKEQMDSVLHEQKFQQTGCTSQECAVKLGKLLNVDSIIVGNCGRLMGEYFIGVRVIDVESGKITYADDVKAETPDDVRGGMHELAVRIANSVM